MKKKITAQDYVKAGQKGSREAEIELYGHPLNHKRVHVSKKSYNRKKAKANLKDLPFYFISSN